MYYDESKILGKRGNNKTQLIALLRNALEERGYGVRIADDDADTLVVRETLAHWGYLLREEFFPC